MGASTSPPHPPIKASTQWECLCRCSQKMSSFQGGPGPNYSSYNQPPSSYYGSNNSGGYYSQWGGYDQYGGYNSGYNSGYNGGYNGGYGYNYNYGYPPPGHMPPPPMGMPPPPIDMSGAGEVRTPAVMSAVSRLPPEKVTM